LSEPLEAQVGSGLFVTFNEESLSIDIDWDEELHPEYNFLNDLTPEQLTQMLLNALNSEYGNKETADLQSGGSSSGAPQGDRNPESHTGNAETD